MTDLVQYLIVAVIVLAAALYAGAKYLPLAWRERIVHRLSRGTGQGWWVKWFGTDASCGSGCGACGSCETGAEGGTDTLPERDTQGRKVIKLHVQR
jgi:hypothetical protein